MNEPPDRELIIQALDHEFGRLISLGEDDKAGVCKDLIDILRHENDRGFYVDLFYRYQKENMISPGGAAIGALYSFCVAEQKSPIVALHEGCELCLDIDSDGMTKVPNWILMELFFAFNGYLCGDSKDLHKAFGIRRGKSGRSKIRSPLEDLNTTEALTINRLMDSKAGGRGAISKAAGKIEEWAREGSPTGNKAFGYEERSVREARRRIRKAFIQRDMKMSSKK